MRARLIKPGFFRDVKLLALPVLTRHLFAGLWCLADREGRLEDEPLQIKIDLLPLDEGDVDAMLNALAGAGFIIRYSANGRSFIQVVNFLKHQTPHIKEAASTIPAPCEHSASTSVAALDPVPITVPVSITVPVTANGHAASGDAVPLVVVAEAVAVEAEPEAPPPEPPASDWADMTWIDDAFEQVFWPAYPRKTHKAEARACWRKLMKRQPTYETALALAEHMLEVLSEQSDAWTDARLTPHPATYLNGERWNDEVIIPTGQLRSSAEPWPP